MIETNDAALINKVISSFTRDNKALTEQLHQLLYWFRGSLSRDDVWALTPFERDELTEFLNKRFEDAGKAAKKGAQVFL